MTWGWHGSSLGPNGQAGSRETYKLLSVRQEQASCAASSCFLAPYIQSRQFPPARSRTDGRTDGRAGTGYPTAGPGRGVGREVDRRVYLIYRSDDSNTGTRECKNVCQFVFSCSTRGAVPYHSRMRAGYSRARAERPLGAHVPTKAWCACQRECRAEQTQALAAAPGSLPQLSLILLVQVLRLQPAAPASLSDLAAAPFVGLACRSLPVAPPPEPLRRQ